VSLPLIYRRWEPGGEGRGLGFALDPGDADAGSFWDEFSTGSGEGGEEISGWFTGVVDESSGEVFDSTDLSDYFRTVGFTPDPATGTIKAPSGQVIPANTTDLSAYLKSVGIVTDTTGKLVNAATGQPVNAGGVRAGSTLAKPAGQWLPYVTNQQVMIGGLVLAALLVLPALMPSGGGGRRRR
jgi:hypothetical protein